MFVNKIVRAPRKRLKSQKSFSLDEYISLFMPKIYGPSAPKPLERVMIFIDGGYLRRLFKDLFGDDNIDFWKIRNDLQKRYNAISTNPFRANLIRAYYYDGITDQKEKEYAQQREYFDELKEHNSFIDVVLGEAVKLSDGTFRQKGVDILMAIDVLTMAHLDHYDSGIFLLADRDFIPLIEAVKDTGKKTFGFFYRENVSKELKWSFDYRIALSKEMIKTWHIQKKEE